MLGQQADVNTKGLDQWTALHLAAKSGHVEILKELLAQEGIEIEACSSMKRTPVHVAAEFDHAEVVKLLLAQGADINSRDFDESTPLHVASQYGSLNTLDYLLKETKAELAAKNKFGYTASDIAQNLSVRQRFAIPEDPSQLAGPTDALSSKQIQQ